MAADRGDDRRIGIARRLRRQAARARSRLEVPDPDVGRSRRRAARNRAACGGDPGWRSRRAHVACARHVRLRTPNRDRRLLAAARRARGEDRLGAGAQLAAGRALGGARACVRAPLGCAAAGGAARCMALRAFARAGRRHPHCSGCADRVWARLACGGRPLPLETARLEAPARVLEPRAHGRDRDRHRLRHATRTRRRRGPCGRARNREGARLLCGDTAPATRAARSRTCSDGDQSHTSRTRSNARYLARVPRGTAAVAALPERAADRRGRIPERTAVGCSCVDALARSRLSRPHARAAGDDRRQGAAPRRRIRARAAQPLRADGRLDRAATRTDRHRDLAAGQRPRQSTRRGNLV